MSYCITLYNTDTYELLPLIGDGVYVEFIEPAGETTGISTPLSTQRGAGGESYNLHGQRVGASYKGIILQNGRKYIKR
jgi:hypothetical protein